jgi:peptidoglycan/xylan/chitin deacetylase (PgdA/CDA1 family)
VEGLASILWRLDGANALAVIHRGSIGSERLTGLLYQGKTNVIMKSKESATPGPILIHPLAKASGKSSGQTSVKRIVTTSWDDGDPSDLRVAEFLSERKLPGTFYIPVKGHVLGNHRACRMSLLDLQELASRGFEIGAHGVSHPNLPRCDEKQLIVEVESSKKLLEDDLGMRISMFAYPRGRHNSKVIASLKHAGYSGARTTAMLARDLRFDPFRMPTSVHVYPHSRFEYFRNLARVWDLRRTWAYATHFRCAENWVELGKILFDSVLRNGGLWHLYGHSWEIEECRLWDGLKEILDYVSNRPGVLYLDNGPLVNLLPHRSSVAEVCPSPTLESLENVGGVESARERRVGL